MKSILQSGQTLIETMVAALVLVMGISAAVTLAIYGFGASEDISKQLIAVGLAREGMEVVKNLRDSNWLKTELSSDCHDFYTTIGNTNVANCYKDWQKKLEGGTYTLGFKAEDNNLDSEDYWQLKSSTNYRLNRNQNNSSLQYGFYTPPIISTDINYSDFSRKIVITPETFSPFDKSDLGPRLKIHVDVWWESDKCPYSVNVPNSSGCKVSLDTYLTNWKNY